MEVFLGIVLPQLVDLVGGVSVNHRLVLYFVGLPEVAVEEGECGQHVVFLLVLLVRVAPREFLDGLVGLPDILVLAREVKQAPPGGGDDDCVGVHVEIGLMEDLGDSGWR